MRKIAILSLLLFPALPRIVSAQNTSGLNPRSIEVDVQRRVEACPRREAVVESNRRHNKEIWVKDVWGPPTNVIADIKADDSLLYPYILTVEFNLTFAEGPERKNKADAEDDPTPSPPHGMRPGKYRNIFLVSKDGIHLKTTEVLETDFYGTPKGWRERPVWLDACWDKIQ